MIISKLRSFFTNTKGVAGIEMALIMPFMLLLYFGMMDVTGLITFNRKNTASASAVADLVAQQPAQFLRSTVMDEFNAAYMIMSPSPQADVHVEVFGFRKAGSGAISQIWKVDNGAGPSCGAAISTASMGTLMAAGNDVIVARSCIIYTPYVAQFMGTTILGATSFTLSQTISVRPRSTLQTNCYQSTVAAGTLCT